MILAIDFDGTISKHPIAFNDICGALRKRGWQVVILTAGAGELPESQRYSEMLRRAAQIGFTEFNQLVSLEKRDKAKWCANFGVSAVIDDEDGVIESIRSVRPKTLLLKVA